MKLLYAYRYGIVGGVSTQLLLRQAALRQAGVTCELFFCQDNGLRQLLPAATAEHVFFGGVRAFQKKVKSGDYDAVVVIDTPELLVSRAKRLYLDVHTTTQRGLGYLDRLDVSQLAGIMVPSNYSADLVAQKVQLSRSQIHVIPNTLNTGVFNMSGQVLPAGTGRREFIWVGKLDQHKNWRLALVYARMLKDKLGDLRFYIVGGYTAPATVGAAFFDLLQDLELQESVVWLDRLANDQLAMLLRRCASSGGAMLVTSRDESFGMAAAEALLCGCPLITNDLPIFREVFPDSPMVQRVDIWQPQQVVNALLRLSKGGASEEDKWSLYETLCTRYGPKAFVSILKKALKIE